MVSVGSKKVIGGCQGAEMTGAIQLSHFFTGLVIFQIAAIDFSYFFAAAVDFDDIAIHFK